MAQLPFNAALRSVAAHPQSKNSSDHKEVNLSLAQARALGGNCFGADIYSVRWPVKFIAEPFRDLMESQVVIELAGGIAEACHRGDRRRRAILAFAESHCAIDADLECAAAVLGDLFRLTGVRYDPQPFAERALALLSANWCAVTALASALVEDRRVEGERVEAIIDAA